MAQEMDANLTFVTPSFKTRSEIWTYFGFMADSDGVVADKKKIACRICRAIIAYSGNTSNNYDISSQKITQQRVQKILRENWERRQIV